jgi:hypothetical protein
MNENETTALVRAFDRAYINGKFVTPHGTKVVDLKERLYPPDIVGRRPPDARLTMQRNGLLEALRNLLPRNCPRSG